eukprot:scaffold58104_cov37-Tisochrysis_lutea.AAC.1
MARENHCEHCAPCVHVRVIARTVQMGHGGGAMGKHEGMRFRPGPTQVLTEGIGQMRDPARRGRTWSSGRPLPTSCMLKGEDRPAACPETPYCSYVRETSRKRLIQLRLAEPPPVTSSPAAFSWASSSGCIVFGLLSCSLPPCSGPALS